MKKELETHGRYNVFATGIPIRQQFIKPTEIAEHSTPTVLIMGGGLGLGAFESTIRALEDVNFKLKIVVVTGINERLQNKLKALQSKHELVILGFVNNISQLMQSADLLISKPGALTLSEAFAVGLPILLLPPIPGPEALNAEYAVSNGAALSVLNGCEAAQAINITVGNERLDIMKNHAKKIARPAAAVEIARIITNSESNMDR